MEWFERSGRIEETKTTKIYYSININNCLHVMLNQITLYCDAPYGKSFLGAQSTVWFFIMISFPLSILTLSAQATIENDIHLRIRSCGQSIGHCHSSLIYDYKSYICFMWIINDRWLWALSQWIADATLYLHLHSTETTKLNDTKAIVQSAGKRNRKHIQDFRFLRELMLDIS